MINEALKHQKKIKTSREKGYCQIRSKSIGLKNRYIQANPLNSYEWIIIDCDYEVPYFKDLPIYPNYIVRNKDNGRAHLYFKVSAVHNNGFSSYKALDYYHGVRLSLTILLKGDMGFNQTLSKNPLAVKDWRVEHIHSKEYDLGELAEYCELVPRYELKELKEAKDRAIVIGRNQTIFDCTRVEAYRLRDVTQEQILEIAEKYNQTLDDPLDGREIGHISKSIWKYVSRPKSKEQKEKFIAKQSERGKKSGVVRAEKAQKLKDKAFVLLSNLSLTVGDIADKLKVSIRRVQDLKAYFKGVQRTISGSPPLVGFPQNPLEASVFNLGDYLVDTFSLYPESEDTEKIPLNTINRLL
jgi:hypothetical protein